jgi:hypothetical protein
MRPVDQHSRATHDELGAGSCLAECSVAIPLRLHIHRETPQFRQAMNVVAQVLLRSSAVVVALDTPTLTSTNNKGSTATILEFQEFERVGPLVGHINQPLIPRQVLRPSGPQQALAASPRAMFGQGLILRNFVTTVQDLVHQSQHRTGLWIDRHHVLADVSAAVSTSDLSQMFGQRLPIGVVQLRSVMDQEHGSLNGGNREDMDGPAPARRQRPQEEKGEGRLLASSPDYESSDSAYS